MLIQKFHSKDLKKKETNKPQILTQPLQIFMPKSNKISSKSPTKIHPLGSSLTAPKPPQKSTINFGTNSKPGSKPNLENFPSGKLYFTTPFLKTLLPEFLKPPLLDYLPHIFHQPQIKSKIVQNTQPPCQILLHRKQMPHKSLGHFWLI